MTGLRTIGSRWGVRHALGLVSVVVLWWMLAAL